MHSNNRNQPNSLPIVQEVVINSPCHENWNEMQGDAAKRFCGSCQKHVHNFSEMSAEEVNQLLATDEKVCVRFCRRPDGTILTKPSTTSRRGWITKVAASAASFLALVSFGGCKEEALGPPITGEPLPTATPNASATTGETLPSQEMGDIAIMGGAGGPPTIQDTISMGGIGGPPIRNPEAKIDSDSQK